MLCTASFWTPSASAQTPPPDVAAAADVDKQGRLCFTPKALAKVLYQFEECKLKLKLANEKWEDDQDAIEDVWGEDQRHRAVVLGEGRAGPARLHGAGQDRIDPLR